MHEARRRAGRRARLLPRYRAARRAGSWGDPDGNVHNSYCCKGRQVGRNRLKQDDRDVRYFRWGEVRLERRLGAGMNYVGGRYLRWILSLLAFAVSCWGTSVRAQRAEGRSEGV